MRRAKSRPFLGRVIALLSTLLGVLAILPEPGVTVIRSGLTSGFNAFIDRFCTEEALGGYTDRTSDAVDYDEAEETVGDLDMGMSNDVAGSRRVFFGMHAPFMAIKIKVEVNGIEGSVAWAYSKGDGTWSPLVVNDHTANFTVNGIHDVEFTAPADWAPDRVTADGGACGSLFYYVRASTKSDDQYTAVPKASQIGVKEYNVRVNVVDEVGRPVSGLAQSNFNVTEGSDNKVYAFRDLGDGRYELGLHAFAADRDYHVQSLQSSFVPALPKEVNDVTTHLTDLTDDPLTLLFPLKVWLFDEHGDSVEEAAVRIGTVPYTVALKNAYYFVGPLSGRLVVAKTDYKPLDPDRTRDLQEVDVQPATRTVIVFDGANSCSSVGHVSAGSSVACPALEFTDSTSSGSGSGSGARRGGSRSAGPTTSQAAEGDPADPTREPPSLFQGHFRPPPSSTMSWLGPGLAFGGLILVSVLAALALSRRRGRPPAGPDGDGFEIVGHDE